MCDNNLNPQFLLHSSCSKKDELKNKDEINENNISNKDEDESKIWEDNSPPISILFENEEKINELFSAQASTFIWSKETKSWNENGKGFLKIYRANNSFPYLFLRSNKKEKGENEFQVKIRQFINPESNLRKMAKSELSWTVYGLDYSFGESNPRDEHFAFRFKNLFDKINFTQAFEDCKFSLGIYLASLNKTSASRPMTKDLEGSVTLEKINSELKLEKVESMKDSLEMDDHHEKSIKSKSKSLLESVEWKSETSENDAVKVFSSSGNIGNEIIDKSFSNNDKISEEDIVTVTVTNIEIESDELKNESKEEKDEPKIECESESNLSEKDEEIYADEKDENKTIANEEGEENDNETDEDEENKKFIEDLNYSFNYSKSKKEGSLNYSEDGLDELDILDISTQNSGQDLSQEGSKETVINLEKEEEKYSEQSAEEEEIEIERNDSGDAINFPISDIKNTSKMILNTQKLIEDSKLKAKMILEESNKNFGLGDLKKEILSEKYSLSILSNKQMRQIRDTVITPQKILTEKESEISQNFKKTFPEEAKEIELHLLEIETLEDAESIISTKQLEKEIANLIPINRPNDSHTKIMFSEEAWSFIWDTSRKLWKNNGLGELEILSLENDKNFIIVQRATESSPEFPKGSATMCHFLQPEMKLKTLGNCERGWRYQAIDYSLSDKDNIQGKKIHFGIRFKSTFERDMFKSAFENCLARLEDSKNNLCKSIISSERVAPSSSHNLLSKRSEIIPIISSSIASNSEQNFNFKGFEYQLDFEGHFFMKMFAETEENFVDLNTGRVRILMDSRPFSPRLIFLPENPSFDKIEHTIISDITIEIGKNENGNIAYWNSPYYIGDGNFTNSSFKCIFSDEITSHLFIFAMASSADKANTRRDPPLNATWFLQQKVQISK